MYKSGPTMQPNIYIYIYNGILWAAFFMIRLFWIKYSDRRMLIINVWIFFAYCRLYATANDALKLTTIY